MERLLGRTLSRVCGAKLQIKSEIKGERGVKKHNQPSKHGIIRLVWLAYIYLLVSGEKENNLPYCL
ncbi:MAG: hypothetical protein MJZ43_01350 [Bacteroidaceae bacterium]|nr:hypothetical protein [Bacteroidaceae bacterium]